MKNTNHEKKDLPPVPYQHTGFIPIGDAKEVPFEMWTLVQRLSALEERATAKREVK